ncbi:MAG: hypothetical protein O7I42_14685 [Alphaproteobacteria bacterium]|nr:hypothetical protein [Alphaproteobacteria bacterium]
MDDVFTKRATIGFSSESRLRLCSFALCFLILGIIVFPPVSTGAESQSKGQNQAFVTMSGGISVKAMQRMLLRAEGIGLWTKLKLQRRINRFTEDFYWYHQDANGKSIAQMRERFIGLHSRVVTLLQPRNPGMSRRFSDARDALWSAYSNPSAFTQSVGKDVVSRIESYRRSEAGQF